jgi:hypothetical protein
MLKHHLAVFFKATACDEIQSGLLAKIIHMSLEEWIVLIKFMIFGEYHYLWQS